MQQLVRVLILGALVLVFAGCADKPAGNPPGPEANSGKTYTKEDAAKAQPVRGGSEGG